MPSKKAPIPELKRYRAGTNKNKVYSRFVQVGAEAARKFGLSVGLAPSSITQWIRTWEREAAKGGTTPPKAAASASARSTTTKKRPTPHKKKSPDKMPAKSPAKKTVAATPVETPKPEIEVQHTDSVPLAPIAEAATYEAPATIQ